MANCFRLEIVNFYFSFSHFVNNVAKEALREYGDCYVSGGVSTRKAVSSAKNGGDENHSAFLPDPCPHYIKNAALLMSSASGILI